MPASFEILTPANSATITMADNAGRSTSEQWVIGRGPKAIYWAILSYAKKHGIRPIDVHYSIVFDDSKGEA